MTYWKKCGKKGKKLTTLILSLAMLGTSTAPSVRLLGQDIANVYADEDVNTSPTRSTSGTSSTEDENIGIPTSDMAGLSDRGNFVTVMFRDYSNTEKMDRYYANAASVEINGEEFPIDQFKFTSEPRYSYGDWTSKEANYEKHKEALYKYDIEGRKYKLVIKLKDGKRGIYLSPDYKAAQEAGEIPADKKPAKPVEDEKPVKPPSNDNTPGGSKEDTDTNGYDKTPKREA